MNIKTESEKVINYWFSGSAIENEIWFQKNKEKKENINIYIKTNFNSLLNYLENLLDKNNITDRINDLIKKYNLKIENLLGIIVCLDQFSRHIYRIENNDTNENKIKFNTNIAYNITRYIIKNYNNTRINENYVVFLLMPYKHLDIVKYFNDIRCYIKNYINIDSNIKNKYDKNKNLYKFYLDSLLKYVQENNELINDTNNNYSENKLIEVCEFYSSETSKNILSKNNLVRICKIFLDKIPYNESILISLSGGPDSMVLAHILTLLCKKNNRTIKGLHINYKNRSESDIEESLIVNFCKRIDLDIYIHRINYFKRCNIERNLYEKVTKKIRFKMYNLIGGNVILGHIKEDLIENIWTNFSQGKDLFKLHKIDDFSIINNVPIYRPFKLVEKKNIYDYANINKIPYLKNTTPAWSNRGKIRNEFLPSVHKQFGRESDEKILYLSESLVSYKKILDKKIFQPLFSSIVYNDYGLKINIHDYLEMDTHFWQHVLTELFHKLGISMPSISSIKNFIIRLNNNKLGIIELKMNIFTYIDNIYNLYILDRDKLKKILKREPTLNDFNIIMNK